MNAAKVLQEHEELLKQGYYLFRREGRRILWFTSDLTWEPYAPFTTHHEARIGLKTILKINPECLECDPIPPFRVKQQPEQERAAV